MNRIVARKILNILIVILLILPSLLTPFKTYAASVSWVGGSGAWETGANWSGGNAPGAADDVTIDANITVTINATTTINSLTLGNGSGTTTPTLTFNYDAIGGTALIVDDGAVNIYSGGTINHTANTTTVIATINLDVQTGDFHLYSGGTVDVDARGYQAYAGPGYSALYSGAGYGGVGGINNGSRGPVYGSGAIPYELGSGGGAGGGGAIRIYANGIFTIDGIVTADGGFGPVNSGGGSGGSIYLKGQYFAGGGTIGADGGSNNNPAAGSGGGGRMRIEHVETNTASWTPTVNSGPYQTPGIGTIFDFQTNLQTGNTVYWDGGALTSNWEDAANWKGDTIPTSITDVRVTAPTTVDLNTTTTINSLTLGNNSGTATPTLNFTYDAITNGALIIDDGNVTVNTNSTITHSVATGGETINGKINIDVQTGNITVEGAISANSKGFIGGALNTIGDGPGGGINQSSTPGYGAGGAGYGGVGGNEGGGTYGTLIDPTMLGSGGGGGGFSDAPGGNGGGTIKISTPELLTVNGSITSNGEAVPIPAAPSHYYTPGGGGSGGSIDINTISIAGSGTISADGGIVDALISAAGAGAGGRISISLSSSNTFTGSISASSGTGGIAATAGTNIVYNSTTTDLLIPNDNYIWKESDLASWTFRNLTVNGDIKFNSESGTLFIISASGATTISDNILIELIGSYTTGTDGSGVSLNLNGDVIIPSNTTISANENGYAGGAEGVDGDGPGGGDKAIVAPGWAAGGGGYGGTGGNTGGSTYGSSTDPIDLGSGGGGGRFSDAPGGNGGGEIRISTTGELTMNGTLSANGANVPIPPASSHYYGAGGAGSGGTIAITTPTLSGTGTIIAKGGDSGPTPDFTGAGAGGGGRIAITYVTNNWTGSSLTPSVSTIKGTGNLQGTDGTINLTQVSLPTVDLQDLSINGDPLPHNQKTITAIYSDVDGATDLDKMYLKIVNPNGTDIEYYADEGATASDITPTAISGATYIETITYDRTAQSPTANDITITWYVETNWTWNPSTDIELGINASDDNGFQFGYNTTTDKDLIYTNELTFSGAIVAESTELGIISSGTWVRPSDTITWTGLTVVYSGTTFNPFDNAFDVSVTNDDSTVWTDYVSAGSEISIASNVGTITDASDIHIFDIINLLSGASDISNITFEVKVDGTKPLAVSGFTGEADSQTEVTLTWNTPVDTHSGVEKVEVYSGTLSSPTGTPIYSGSLLTHSVSSLTHSTQYTYTIFVYDNVGYISDATTTIVTTDSPPPVVITEVPPVEEEVVEEEIIEEITQEDVAELIEGSTEFDNEIIDEEIVTAPGENIEISIPKEDLEDDDKEIETVIFTINGEVFIVTEVSDSYTISSSAPSISGEYDISIVTVYTDGSVKSSSTSMIVEDVAISVAPKEEDTGINPIIYYVLVIIGIIIVFSIPAILKKNQE